MQRKKPHTSLKRIFWRFAISALKSEHSDGVDLNESALRNVVAAERDAGRLHGADEGLRVHVVDLVEVFDVLHVDGGAADVFDAGACGVKNMLDVLQCLGCLLAGGFASQFAGGRSMPSWPETNTKPLAFTAWLYAPSAAGASEVATASIFSLIMFSFEECVMHVACVQAAANHDNAISSNHCTHGIDTHCPMFQIPAPCPGSSLVFVVGLMGIEPTTFCSGDRRSIH